MKRYLLIFVGSWIGGMAAQVAMGKATLLGILIATVTALIVTGILGAVIKKER